MTDFKIPDEAVEAALKAWFEDPSGDGLDSACARTGEWRRRMRDALGAALPVMLEPVRVGRGGKLTLYRLKEPK